jgi:hypothetical protein
MEKIKNFWEEHKTKIIVVGGVILTGAAIVILKGGNNPIGKRIADDYTGYTKEKVLDFINGADDNLKYAIFKESDFFNVVHL